MGTIKQDVAHRARRLGEPLGRLPVADPAAFVVRALFHYVHEMPAVQPASGWISHDAAAGTLWVSSTAANGADMRTKLALLDPGDEIRIGPQSYTISAMVPGAYSTEFAVTPLIEAASNGMVTLELRRVS